MTSDERYTYEQAVIIGKRHLCDDGDGHNIEQYSQRDLAGRRVFHKAVCVNCDVEITFTYPPLPPAKPGMCAPDGCVSFAAKCLLDGCQKGQP